LIEFLVKEWYTEESYRNLQGWRSDMKSEHTRKHFYLLIVLLILFVTLSGCSNKDNASVIVIDETITANGSKIDELSPKENQNTLNLLSNGTFDENLLSWEISTESQEAATMSMVDQRMMIHITDPGASENAIMILSFTVTTKELY
jgi:hypothetical protein